MKRTGNKLFLNKGDILIKEGENSNSMYWLQKGSLEVYCSKSLKKIHIGNIHSGELVGEMSFLDHQPRSASVMAQMECELIEIPNGKFEEILKVQPSWFQHLLTTLTSRLRETDKRVKI